MQSAYFQTLSLSPRMAKIINWLIKTLLSYFFYKSEYTSICVLTQNSAKQKEEDLTDTKTNLLPIISANQLHMKIFNYNHCDNMEEV